MDNLLQLLETLNNSHLPDLPHIILNEYANKEIKLLVATATALLVDDNGKQVWENHTILKERGFDVFPGETDRAGWLSGCIQTKKGILVFGS